MGNRGSKSVLSKFLLSAGYAAVILTRFTVKEQRVDGSSTIYNYYCNNVVRCTLVAGKPVLGRKWSNPRLKIPQ